MARLAVAALLFMLSVGTRELSIYGRHWNAINIIDDLSNQKVPSVSELSGCEWVFP
jgi:hypothetical protein